MHFRVFLRVFSTFQYFFHIFLLTFLPTFSALPSRSSSIKHHFYCPPRLCPCSRPPLRHARHLLLDHFHETRPCGRPSRPLSFAPRSEGSFSGTWSRDAVHDDVAHSRVCIVANVTAWQVRMGIYVVSLQCVVSVCNVQYAMCNVWF